MSHDREKFKNDEYRGEDYNCPLELEEGPVDDRGCTDCLCYLLFIVFLGAMMGCSGYGYIYGSPGKLLAPVDGDGNFCGYSPGFENYRYLFIWDIRMATNSP